MATHSSTLAWKIPWTEEPGRLQSMGSQRVGHDWVTSLFTFFIFEKSLKSSIKECSQLRTERRHRNMTGRRVRRDTVRTHSPGPMTQTGGAHGGRSPPPELGAQAPHQAPQPGRSPLGRWSPRSLALKTVRARVWESWRAAGDSTFTLEGAHKTSRAPRPSRDGSLKRAWVRTTWRASWRDRGTWDSPGDGDPGGSHRGSLL